MFSADYPYSSMELAHSFLNQLPVTPPTKIELRMATQNIFCAYDLE